MSSPAVHPPAAEAAAEQQLREARLCLQQATEEMKAFQIVERFLSGVERAILGRVSPPFESRPVTDALQALDLAIRAADVPRLEAALKLFAGEFDVWRAAITRRDAQLSPFDLRRFCERGDVSLDPQTFAALTRFYRARPRSEAAQSKYDFVVTRLFTRTDAPHRRALRLGSDRLAVSLAKMCAAWGETIRADGEGAQLPEARRQFDAFIAEAAALTRLEDWVAADLFGRLRAFKLGLGAAFYAPEITAAAIHCNVAVANRFSALLAVESEQVRNAPAACQALSDLFSNTSDGVPDHVREALAELGSSEVNADVAAAERLQRLARLLQIASASPAEQAGSLAAAPPDTAAETAAACGAAPPAPVAALAADEKNQEIIADYLQASAGVRALDLGQFLAPLPEADDERRSYAAERRQALVLILRADRLARMELQARLALGDELEGRLAQLLNDLASASASFRDLASRAQQRSRRESADVLLQISSHLLAAQLRLQAAVVRRSAVELSQVQPATAAPATRRPQVSLDETPRRPAPGAPEAPPRRRARLWLAAATAVLAVVALAVHFVVPREGLAEGRDKEVVVFDHAQLPDGHLLAGARVRRNVMICRVAESWAGLSGEQRREKLQAWLHYGQGRGVGTVLLLDAQGLPAGSASAQQIVVESAPPSSP